MKYLRRILLALLLLLLLSGATVFVIITFYKKELATLLTDTLKANYGLLLKVEDVNVTFFTNWPHASVKLKNVSIASSLAKDTTEPILKASAISLSFDLKKMLAKQFVLKYISVNDAEITLIRYKDSSKNFDFKKQVPDSQATAVNLSMSVNSIELRNVKFKFINQERGQRVAINFMDVEIKPKVYLDGLEASVSGKTLVEGLLFNPKNGEFLKNTRILLDLKLNYLKENKTICIHPPSKVEIEGHDYSITSLIDLDDTKRLALSIQSKKVKAERVAALLMPKIRKVLSNFEVKRPLDAKILLVVNLGQKQDPVIITEIIGENCDLAIGKSKIPYSGLFFRGRIISLDSTGTMGDADRARIIFDRMKGRVYDFPFTATVGVTNFTDPQIVIEASVLIEAQKIKFEVAKNFILRGSALTTIRYSGPASKLNKEEFLDAPMRLNAYLLFNNLSYREIDRPYVYTVNGKANLNNRDLKFDNLSLKTHVANAIIQGRAENFVPYVLGFTKGFKATVNASTDNLDLNPLLVKHHETDKIQSDNSNSEVNKKISTSRFEFNVNLFAKRLLIRKVEAQEAKVALYYKDNFFEIKSLNVNTCGGKIAAKGAIKDFNKINADVSIQGVNVKKLFDQFENFGQKAIAGDNLEGTMFVDGKFKVELDENMEFKGESMAGEAKLKLKNGHLLNYEPIQNLSNYIFRNRDFKDVAFTELNETFKIRGYEMQIDELEIGSNVLNLYVVNGLYNIKGNSNINILIPWSNLKRRGKNYIPKNTGESAENTKGVKLNFYGPAKNLKINLGHKEQEKRFW